jgi:hypothetical protein
MEVHSEATLDNLVDGSITCIRCYAVGWLFTRQYCARLINLSIQPRSILNPPHMINAKDNTTAYIEGSPYDAG